MKIAVIQFPGSNCERETKLAIERCGMQAYDFLWNHDCSTLNDFDGFVIVGGFSYEDRVRSGIIASLDPLMNSLREQAALGKPLLGICNGAQILVENGLVPGLAAQEKAIALAHNNRISEGKVLGTGFYNDWVSIKTSGNLNNAFCNQLSSDDILNIPAAHAEGRFILEDGLYQKLVESNAAIFYYCDKHGEVKNDFPHNPNGSDHNLAAISNAQGNVMAIMPHPERTKNGDKIFASMKHYILNGSKKSQQVLDYQAPKPALKTHSMDLDGLEFIIGLNIHDNEAISLENALQLAGFKLRLKKYMHWTVKTNGDKEKIKKQLCDSLELFNPSKEFLSTLDDENGRAILVVENDDCIAKSKLDHLKHHFEINGIKSLQRAKLWIFQHEDKDILSTEVQQLISRNILANPLSQQCFEFDLQGTNHD